MNYTLPNTEERRAAMAALRRNALAGKQRALAAGTYTDSRGNVRALSKAERKALEDDCAHIQQVQRAKGEA
jgi:hypothetical protein